MIEMKTEEIENLLTNVLRFFFLLLVTAGIMIGMGIHFLLDYIGSGHMAEMAFVELICLGVVGAFIWQRNLMAQQHLLEWQHWVYL